MHTQEIDYTGRSNTLVITLVISAILAMTLVVMVGYFYVVSPERETLALGNPAAVGEVGHPEDFARDTSAFEGLILAGRSAVVFDVVHGTHIYAHNADEQQPLASLTKLMTALVAYETLAQEQKVQVSTSALEADGDSGLRQDEAWTLNELLDFTLVTSSNDGAQAIAAVAGAQLDSTSELESFQRLAFVQKMNERARALGLTNMYFVNASGLDLGTTASGSYGTAHEVAKLLAHIITHHPDLLASTRDLSDSYQSLDGIVHEARNTNVRVGNIPGLIASKTGFTDLAGGNLAVAFDVSVDHPVVVVVLGSTFEERFVDTERLVEATREYFSGKF